MTSTKEEKVMKNTINTEILNFVFNRLRLQEGIVKSKNLDKVDNSTLYKLLYNAKFKQDHNFPLTNLEQLAKDNSGKFIQMYISQKYDETKKIQPIRSLPFEEVAHLTLGDLNDRDRCA